MRCRRRRRRGGCVRLRSGLGNRTASTLRPLVYLTYAKPWFKDSFNFSRQRYRDLPPLVAERAKKAVEDEDFT